MIHIRYFARLRERLGTQGEDLPYEDGLGTVGGVAAHLAARGGVWAEALGGGERVMMAVDQVLAQPQTRVVDGSEVAFFPPVTGG